MWVALFCSKIINPGRYLGDFNLKQPPKNRLVLSIWVLSWRIAAWWCHDLDTDGFWLRDEAARKKMNHVFKLWATVGALSSGSALEIVKQMDKASTNLLPVELCGAVQRCYLLGWWWGIRGLQSHRSANLIWVNKKIRPSLSLSCFWSLFHLFLEPIVCSGVSGAATTQDQSLGHRVDNKMIQVYKNTPFTKEKIHW